MDTHRTARLDLDAAQLLADFPPRFQDRNKQLVYAIGGPQTAGTITMSRWATRPLPREPGPPTAVSRHEGFFPYGGGPRDCWVNFADPELFGFYAGGLYAQDEMQVTEHPALASVRSAMAKAGVPTRTREGGHPTPVLVRGVERRVTVDTQPDLAAGRIEGLYGNRFSRASEAVLRSATRKLDPVPSTILAIAAPSPHHGLYDRETILDALTTAYTGFAAAEFELGPGTVVHSGFWGCGAFGGNRVLMVAIQILAARLAGVGIAFHHGHITGQHDCDEAIALSQRWSGSTADVVDSLVAARFEWGVSDGN